jgi:hypothetical protein
VQRHSATSINFAAARLALTPGRRNSLQNSYFKPFSSLFQVKMAASPGNISASSYYFDSD